MISKNFYFLIILIPAFIFSGCSEFLKGKPAKEKTVEINQEAMSCLKDISLEISKFLKSESTDDNIEKTFNCIDSTLKEFQMRVEGKEAADSFNAVELFQIFDKFIKNSTISKATTEDLLALKSAMLGGSEQRITKSEILILRDFLISLKAEVKNLLPYARLFTFARPEVPFSKTMIKSGFAQLSLSLKNLLKITKFTHSNYNYEDFKSMLVHLKLVDKAPDGKLALADKINDLIIGNVIISTEADRELYIDNLTEVLKLYVTQIQGYVKFEITEPSVTENTLQYIVEMVSLLENSVQFKKTKLISVESLDPVIIEMQKNNILPIKLTVETALSFYKTLLVRIFDSGLNSEVKAFKGLEKIHFVNLKREIAVYRLFSRLINQIEDPASRLSLKNVQRIVSQFKTNEQQDILREFDQEAQAEIVRIIDEFKTEFLRDTPTVYRFNKIVVAANQEIWDQNWQDLSRSFHTMMISRMLIIGWGNSPQSKVMKNASISEQGIVQWYSEFKPFGVEIKSFDPRTVNAGIGTLNAANLFTRSGNGDNKMDFREMTEQLGMVLTGGGQTFNEMHAGFAKAHCNLNELDVFNYNWNNESCVKQDLRTNYKYYFSNLSHLVSYLDKLNEEQFSDFYSALMDVARKDDANKNIRLETADLRSMSILFHYIESMFAAYDKNMNLGLSEIEIRTAYPKFRSFAADYAHKNAQWTLNTFNNWLGSKTGYGCYNENDLIQYGFIYLVINSRSAGVTDLNIAPCLFNRPLIDLKGEVNRKGLINTFKILKAVLG